MKISELIEQLSKYDPDTLVVKSKNGEGNEYQVVSVVCVGRFEREEGRYGGGNLYILHTILTKKLRELGFTQDDINPDAPRAVVLY